MTAAPRVAYLDCVHGAAGDMLLGALVDAGCPLDAVRSAVAAVGVDEVRLESREVHRAGLRALQVEVVDVGGARRRTLGDCLAAVSVSGLADAVTAPATAVLSALGAAEARLHGLACTDEVHLHELSGADTLVDVVGVCAALAELGVATVHASPLPAAPGTVATGHGELPLPSPATMALLAEAGAALVPGRSGVEEVTPTAAALLAVLARFEVPAMRLEAVGHGAGARDDPRRPNLVRCWLGTADPAASPPPAGFDDPCVELRTNLDDASPAVVSDLAVRCLEAGALDAWVVAATMKRGRPGHVLHVLVPPGRDAAIATLLLAQSPSLGVRRSEAPRMLAGRDTASVDSPLGPVRVKRKLLGGHVVDARPEIEDCRRLARATGRPLHEVLDTVTAAARAALVEDGG